MGSRDQFFPQANAYIKVTVPRMSVQFSSVQASLPATNSQSIPKPMSIESVMPSNHLILCRPLLLPRSIFPSIRVFSNESALHIWRRQWQPTPVLLLGQSEGQRSLVGCSPWVHEQSDTTERLHFHFSLSCIGNAWRRKQQPTPVFLPGESQG